MKDLEGQWVQYAQIQFVCLLKEIWGQTFNLSIIIKATINYFQIYNNKLYKEFKKEELKIRKMPTTLHILKVQFGECFEIYPICADHYLGTFYFQHQQYKTFYFKFERKIC